MAKRVSTLAKIADALTGTAAWVNKITGGKSQLMTKNAINRDTLTGLGKHKVEVLRDLLYDITKNERDMVKSKTDVIFKLNTYR
jgi:predicted nucleic acid-binding protein